MYTVSTVSKRFGHIGIEKEYMTIDSTLLKILVCPETKTPVSIAAPELIARLNAQVEQGSLMNRSGKHVSVKFESGLVRSDGKILYPIRDDIPVMLVDEGILL